MTLVKVKIIPTLLAHYFLVPFHESFDLFLVWKVKLTSQLKIIYTKIL